MSGSGEKKYGLIIPARKKAGAAAGKPIAKLSVFRDSSSDEEVGQDGTRVQNSAHFFDFCKIRSRVCAKVLLVYPRGWAPVIGTLLILLYYT